MIRDAPSTNHGGSLRSEVILVGAIGLVFALLCVWLIRKGAPFGHDEAVYAVKAKDLGGASTSSYLWSDYRAPGLPFFLRLGEMFGNHDYVLRLIVVVFGGLLVLFSWLIGRTLFSGRVGLIAAAGVASTPVIITSSASVWPDVPGAALGLVVLAVLMWSIRGVRVSWWVLLAAPLTILATVVRFGAPLPVVVGGLGLAIWKRDVLARSIPQLVVLITTTAAGVGAVLTMPRVLGTEKSPLAAISAFNEARDLPAFQGIVDYFTQYESLIATPSGLVLIVGLAWGAIAARRSNEARKAFLVASGIGLATMLMIALTLHGESRYLVPAYPWLWIGAAYGLDQVLSMMQQDLRRPLVGVAVVGMLLAGAAEGAAAMRTRQERFSVLRAAARQLDVSTVDGQCGVITGYGPQVEWYSACLTAPYSLESVRLTGTGFPSEAVVYLMYVERGKRQPVSPLLDEYLESVTGECVEVGAPTGGPLRFVSACAIDDS